MKTMNKVLTSVLGIGLVMSMAAPAALARHHHHHHGNSWRDGYQDGWNRRARYDRGYGGYGGGGWNNCRRDRWDGYNRGWDRHRAYGYGGDGWGYDRPRRGYW